MVSESVAILLHLQHSTRISSCYCSLSYRSRSNGWRCWMVCILCMRSYRLFFRPTAEVTMAYIIRRMHLAFISILNFIIFFLSSRNMKPYSPGQMKRKNDFKRKMRQAERPVNVYANGAKHRCAVCGRTEMDDPNLEFRYCSKCNGNYEYCQDHLFTHTHVK